MAVKKKSYSPPLKCWGFLKEVNDAYDQKIIDSIKAGTPVVAATAMAPQQLINAFDVVYIAGEWYGSICGFHRDNILVETAESCGFPHELCSYARMTLGSMIKRSSFLGKYPIPVAVIGTEGFCNVQAKWFEAMARYDNIPFFVIDNIPVQQDYKKNWGEEAVTDSVNFVIRQLENCIDFLEWSTGQKINEEKLIKTTITMHRNEDLWDDLLDLLGKKPSPFTIRNMFTFENLIISLPCTDEASRVLEAGIEEVQERVEKGIAALENEQIRLIWQAQPGWYLLNVLKYFESEGAAFVASPYLALWGTKFRYDCCEPGTPDWFREWKDPTNLAECLRQIAIGAVAVEIRPRLDADIRVIKKMAIETQADGGVWHAVRGCKGVSFGGLGEREALRNELGLPGFVMEGSPSDSRDFSEGPALRQIKVFIEQVKRMKKRRKIKEARAAKS